MRRGFLLFFLLVVSVFAKENYSQMSTQELIEIIGFVDEKDKVSFQKELEFRIPKMSSFEREQYENRV